MKWKVQVSLRKPYEDLYAFEPNKEQALESFLDSLRAGELENLLDIKIIAVENKPRYAITGNSKMEKYNTKRRCKWRTKRISWCRKLEKFCNSPYEYDQCSHYEPKRASLLLNWCKMVFILLLPIYACNGPV